MRQNKSDLVFSITNYSILSLFLVVTVYPLLYVVSASFSDPVAVITGEMWLFPIRPNFAGYQAVFRHRLIMSGFANSLFYASMGTAVNVVVTVLAAYPLSRKDLVGRNTFMFIFAFTMMFSGGLIPSYILVRNLGLIDSRWSMIIPSAMGVWQVIIARTYFQSSIPDSLLEASQIDGCSDYRFVWSIVIPLSGPIIAVTALFYAVGHWNAFFAALIYLSSADKFPLQLVLRDVLIQSQMDEATMGDVATLAARQNLVELVKYALIVVASLPLLIAYPFVQKYFVKGIMIGAIKG